MDQMQGIMDSIDGLLAAAEDAQDTALAESLAGLHDAIMAVADASPDAPETQALIDALVAMVAAMTGDETADTTEAAPTAAPTAA